MQSERQARLSVFYRLAYGVLYYFSEESLGAATLDQLEDVIERLYQDYKPLHDHGFSFKEDSGRFLVLLSNSLESILERPHLYCGGGRVFSSASVMNSEVGEIDWGQYINFNAADSGS